MTKNQNKIIKIEELTDKDRGRWVRYTASHGASEDGKIKSWNDRFVFVVYKCAGNWSLYENYTGQATKPEDLEFI